MNLKDGTGISISTNLGDLTIGLTSTYAGGTAVTLNESSKSGSTASFYAPTTVGDSGYILKSNGSGAPTWIAQSSLSVGTSSTCTGNAKTATSLATARTIWGQSFNGNANISGDMTGVGNITLQGTTRTKDFGSDGNSIRTLYTRSISCDST